MEMWMWEFLIFVPIVLIVYKWWRRKAWVGRLHQKAVFITGCDSGFGNAAAKSLYARGVYVYAGCYTKTGAELLREETGDRLITILVDVTSTDSVQQAYKYVTDTLPQGIEFWGIINNAGILGQLGPLELLNKDDFKQVFDVNFYGMIDVTNTFLPLLKTSKGRIVNTCSLASTMATPNLIPYTTSKWAIKGFSETIRLEKAPWGIKVSTIAPGGFQTNISNAKQYADRIKTNWTQVSPEIREQYGEDHIEKVLDTYEDMMKTLSKDLNPVVSAYEDALFSECPQHIYYPGAEMIRFMPVSVLAMLFNMSKVKPQALQKK